jgi:hypothetical protein
MQQKNVISTKPQTTLIPDDLPVATWLDFNPSQETNNTATHVVFTTVLPATKIQKAYSNQTRKCPVQCSRGYNYVVVLYDYDSNASPMLSRL